MKLLQRRDDGTVDWWYTRFTLRHRVKTAFKSLSWLPLWWVRGQIPRDRLGCTPAQTIRSLSAEVDRREAAYASMYALCTGYENQLRELRRQAAAARMTPGQKEWCRNVMGVDFDAGEGQQ
jgi:hypothetical protein